MRSRHIAILLLLVFIAFAVLAAALMLGGSGVPLEKIMYAISHPHDGTVESAIIWRIRLPRAMIGFFVGAGLAVSGVALQGMLRNPLAEPYTLGISGGAALGATAAIVSGLAVLYLPLFAFAGALICITAVYAVSSRRGFSIAALILCGVILGFLFSSLTLLILALARSEKVYGAVIWLMGDLGSCDATLVMPVIIIVSAGILVCSFYGKHLNILTLGEEKAIHLGVDAERVKKVLFAATSLMAGACVASCGIIGFVGLIVPHVIRFAAGPDHRFLIPASALAGGAFLVSCDTLARTAISPLELPVGVITGITGGAFFLGYILMSGKREIF